MKKILGLTALALIGLVSYASAGPLVAPHFVTKSLSFRTHIAAPTTAQITQANTGYDQMGFYIDSLATSKATTTGVMDTTAAISTAGWAAPNSFAAPDSGFACNLVVMDAGANLAGTDSLYTQAQVSADGVYWVTAARVGASVVNAFTIGTSAGGTVLTALPIGGTGATNNVWVQRFNRYSVTGGLPVGSTLADLASWPLIRFIFKGTDALQLNIKARLSYFSADEDLNK